MNDNYPNDLSRYDLAHIEGDDISGLIDFAKQEKTDYEIDCIKYGENF